MSEFKENTKYVDFFAQKQTIYRFYRFATTKNRFLGYFNDLTNIWHILTAWRHFMSDFKENTKSGDFFAQKARIYRFYRFSTSKNRFFGVILPI